MAKSQTPKKKNVKKIPTVIDARRKLIVYKPPPCPDGACVDCHAQHKPEEPHNPMSAHYQLSFHRKNGRWATWKDAIDHCLPNMKEWWINALKAKKAWNEPTKAQLETQRKFKSQKILKQDYFK